jgi:hypothetical protein
MGNKTAQAIATEIALGRVQRGAAIEYHLTANCYPPIPAAMAEFAIPAIDACNEGDPDRLIDISPVRHVTYGPKVPARVLMDSWFLWAFADQEEEF